jgi:sigma-E factor negative regulatory protein RseB
MSFSVRSDEDIKHWLMKMNNAALELNYRGIFVYVKQNQIEVMRVVHQSQDGVIKERIYSLNGAPREIVRDAEQVWCYLPDRRMGVHEYRQVSSNNFPHILPKQLDQLDNNYRITMGDKGRIADRNAVQIWILPKDEYRYGHDLWVDEDTGLLLKSSLMDADSEPIEQYMFTEIHIGNPIAEKDLAPLTPKKQLVWYGVNKKDEPKNVQGDVKWEAARYPDGFMLSRKIKRISPIRNQLVEHLVYSDGLAAVSIFVEKLADSTKPIRGLNSMGAINAYGTVIDNHQVTVVGEVPSKTVNMIAMSVIRTE